MTTLSRSTEHEADQNERESIWTFPRQWRVRFFVIFYSLVIGTTVWGTYETIVSVAPNGLNYRSFIVVYVQSIAGAVVTSMLIIDLMRSITMLSNAIEDWLIEKRKKRAAYWEAREAEMRAKRQAEEKRLRAEGMQYGLLVAEHKARGEDPPPPPWEN